MNWRAITLAMALAMAACTSPGTSNTDTDPGALDAPTSTTLATTEPPTTTTGPSTTTTTTAPATTSPPEMFAYAVVAEEDARRLAFIDVASSECFGEGAACEVAPVLTVDLPYRPHNTTGVGSVVYATHPEAGAVSRFDAAGDDVMTVAVGTEPHDIHYDQASGLLLVADEAGRRLLHLDPETLQVVGSLDLPGEAHDLAIAEGAVWVTLVGRDELARVGEDDGVELFATGRSPHDLAVDHEGSIWFSNWNSSELNIFEPTTGGISEAPAGVSEPHHFALDADGTVWVSDNGGSSVVGFTSPQTTVEVGPVPHHLEFLGEVLVVAVSGAGSAVYLVDGAIAAVTPLTPGLHGVAVVETTEPIFAG